MKCEKCIYRKNCQFLGKHKNVKVSDCTAFVSETDFVKEAKAEAVREFAEKLKEQAFECDISFGLGSQRVKEAVAVDDIDNLVKEFAKDINVRANPEQVKGEENAENRLSEIT